MAQLAQTSEQIKVKIQTNTNAKGLSKIVDFHFSEIQKIEIPHFANEDLDAAATRGYNPLIRKLMELMNHEQFKRCYDAEILPIDELIVKGNDKFYESIGYGVRDVDAARAIETIVSILGKLEILYSITIKLDITQLKNAQSGGEIILEGGGRITRI